MNDRTTSKRRIAPDFSVICTGSDDASVRLFSAESGDFLGSNNLHKRNILDLNFVPNSQKVQVVSGASEMSASQVCKWENIRN